MKEIDGPISITDHLVGIFSFAISNAFPNISNLPPAIIAPGTNPKFGDYQCNNSMQLAQFLKNSEEFRVGGVKLPSPHTIATKVLENLPKSPLIAKCDVAGPGFINIYLERSYAEKALTSILLNGVQAPKFDHHRVVVDFSSPNIGEFKLLF